MERSAEAALTTKLSLLSAKEDLGLNLRLLDHIPRLTKPSVEVFRFLTPSSSDAARTLLIQQRATQPGQKPALRHRFSSIRLKDQADQAKWKFTKHEVATAFDVLLSHTPLAPVGVAQAVLSHAPGVSIDDLWCHLHDAKLEKRTASLFRRSRQLNPTRMGWLDQAAQLGSSDYILLMCYTGVAQEYLDSAFSIALSQHSMYAISVLLAYGATVSICRDSIRECFRLHDVDLAKLLLAAPSAMSALDWKHCIEFQVTIAPTIAALCLVRYPDLSSGFIFCEAVKSENLELVALMLATAGSRKELIAVRREACRLVSRMKDDDRRRKFFAIFSYFDWVTDTEYFQEELLAAVTSRRLDLIRIFVSAGITLDVEPNNALFLAISYMDLNVLELLKDGNYSSSISSALKLIPDSTSEQDWVLFLRMFRDRLGKLDDALHFQLIRAVQKRQILLVQMLISCNASIEYEDAQAIRIAITAEDFKILNVLLQATCSPEALQATTPPAMAVKSRSVRLWMMMSLCKKGVQPRALGAALFRLLSEDGEVDMTLLRLLLKYKADVEDVGSSNYSCVSTVIRKGNILVLEMLCKAGLRMQTSSNAVATAFEAIPICGYDVALAMIKLLLDNGAAPSDPVHDTLLAAASHDPRLEIVRLLVKQGGNANYRGGACFLIALETGHMELLHILYEGCPPSQSNVISFLPKLLDPRCYNFEALQLVLGSCSSCIPALNAMFDSPEALKMLKDNPNVTAIIPCLLQHGLDVDTGHGALPCFAIQQADIGLLKSILSAGPNTSTLRTAFLEAKNMMNKNSRLEIMELLLRQAGPAEIGQSECLWQQTHSALAGDIEGLKLLLRHGASVDFDNGSAIQTAAHSGSREVLDLLLARRPLFSSISRACLAVTPSSLDTGHKYEVFELLLSANSGASPSEMASLMADSISNHPGSIQLPNVLLARGVEPGLDTLKTVLSKCPLNVCLAFLSRIKSRQTTLDIFKLISTNPRMPSSHRLPVYQCLLPMHIPQVEISEALIHSFNGPLPNLDVPKLLLEHGAKVGHNNMKAFQVALFKSHSIEGFKLLTQYIKDDVLAEGAFVLARKYEFEDQAQRTEIFQRLLQWQIGQSSVQRALEETVQAHSPDTSIVQLLLRKGADPNQEKGRCFALACRASSEPVFRALSRYADLGLVLRGLIRYFEREGDEGDVVRWFNMCLEERAPESKIEQEDLLFLCMEKFPQSTAILRLVLDNGVSASAMTNLRLSKGWQAERCTALIWALSSKPRVENEVILLLLERGKKSALPSYATPVTEVSAALLCLLDPSRTAILKALLKLDKSRILSSEIPRSSFSQLSASSEVSYEDLSDLQDRLSLHWAALYLGNFDAFRLVHQRTGPNDGLLHLTALLALPKFVKWLLKVDDPNLKEEDFDYRIPLAVTCDAKPLPWCKIADEEDDFRARQRSTMRLLARVSDLKWRYRGKTVLHLALEGGIDTTNAMIDALKYRSDADRQRKSRYTDRGGKEYSLQEYVSEFVNGTDEEKQVLIKCLSTRKSRKTAEEEDEMADKLGPVEAKKAYRGAKVRRTASEGTFKPIKPPVRVRSARELA